jgi:hypothetical protein
MVKTPAKPIDHLVVFGLIEGTVARAEGDSDLGRGTAVLPASRPAATATDGKSVPEGGHDNIRRRLGAKRSERGHAVLSQAAGQGKTWKALPGQPKKTGAAGRQRSAVVSRPVMADESELGDFRFEAALTYPVIDGCHLPEHVGD